MSDQDILRAHTKELLEFRTIQLAEHLDISEEMALNYITVDILLAKKNGTL